jgi:hypothetical protein
MGFNSGLKGLMHFGNRRGRSSKNEAAAYWIGVFVLGLTGGWYCRLKRRSGFFFSHVCCVSLRRRYRLRLRNERVAVSPVCPVTAAGWALFLQRAAYLRHRWWLLCTCCCWNIRNGRSWTAWSDGLDIQGSLHRDAIYENDQEDATV